MEPEARVVDVRANPRDGTWRRVEGMDGASVLGDHTGVERGILADAAGPDHRARRQAVAKDGEAPVLGAVELDRNIQRSRNTQIPASQHGEFVSEGPRQGLQGLEHLRASTGSHR
jgi:hypothetical protein